MKLYDYFPRFLQELVEFGEIVHTEQPEFDLVTIAVEEMPLDFSAFTLTIHGIQRWEEILGITGMEADDLDSRRFRIQARLMEQIPITKRTLYGQLETLCGKGGFTMTVDYGEYSLGVRVALTSKSKLGDVDELVHKSVPANLMVSVSLLYNQHEKLARYTHDQLAVFTHKELREEVLP